MKQPITPDEIEGLLAGVNDFDAYNKCHEFYTTLYQQHMALREAVQQIADRGDIPADDYEKKYKGDKLRHYSSMIAKRALRGDEK